MSNAQHRVVTVESSPTKITVLPWRRNRREEPPTIVVRPVADLYLGGPNVSPTDYGLLIKRGETLGLAARPGEHLFACVTDGPVEQPILFSGWEAA